MTALLERASHLKTNRRGGSLLVHLVAEAPAAGGRLGVCAVRGSGSVSVAFRDHGRSGILILDPDLARTVGTALLAAARVAEREARG